MSEPMTLREGLQELTEQLREQGKMVVLLDAILAATAAADAERDRLARIGELVEDIYASRSHLQLSHVTGNPSAIIASSSVWVGDAYSRKHEQGTADTLLAALEALKERCG